MKDALFQFEELSLGSRLKRLSDYMMREVSIIYNSLEIDFDPYLMPILKLVNDSPELTIGEISELLGVTQPAVTQFSNALQKRKLILIKKSTIDKRKRKIILSKNGKEMIKKLNPIWIVIDRKTKQLSQNKKNTTLLEHISFMEKEFENESFSSRVLHSFLNTSLKDLKIIDFEKKLSHHFRDLNFEWLSTYFYIEDHDKEVLENAQNYIIDKNGYIFFAVLNNKVVGTVALINEEEGYELSKMAVSPDYQGFKIGQALLKHCINFARRKKWTELYIYSNTILENAIYIYKKYGWIEIPIENSPYQRSDIKMVLKLD